MTTDLFNASLNFIESSGKIHCCPGDMKPLGGGLGISPKDIA